MLFKQLLLTVIVSLLNFSQLLLSMENKHDVMTSGEGKEVLLSVAKSDKYAQTDACIEEALGAYEQLVTTRSVLLNSLQKYVEHMSDTHESSGFVADVRLDEDRLCSAVHDTCNSLTEFIDTLNPIIHGDLTGSDLGEHEKKSSRVKSAGIVFDWFGITIMLARANVLTRQMRTLQQKKGAVGNAHKESAVQELPSGAEKVSVRLKQGNSNALTAQSQDKKAVNQTHAWGAFAGGVAVGMSLLGVIQTLCSSK